MGCLLIGGSPDDQIIDIKDDTNSHSCTGTSYERLNIIDRKSPILIDRRLSIVEASDVLGERYLEMRKLSIQ